MPQALSTLIVSKTGSLSDLRLSLKLSWLITVSASPVMGVQTQEKRGVIFPLGFWFSGSQIKYLVMELFLQPSEMEFLCRDRLGSTARWLLGRYELCWWALACNL